MVTKNQWTSPVGVVTFCTSALAALSVGYWGLTVFGQAPIRLPASSVSPSAFTPEPDRIAAFLGVKSTTLPDAPAPLPIVSQFTLLGVVQHFGKAAVLLRPAEQGSHTRVFTLGQWITPEWRLVRVNSREALLVHRDDTNQQAVLTMAQPNHSASMAFGGDAAPSAVGMPSDFPPSFNAIPNNTAVGQSSGFPAGTPPIATPGGNPFVRPNTSAAPALPQGHPMNPGNGQSNAATATLQNMQDASGFRQETASPTP